MEYKKSFSKNKKKTHLNLKWQCPNALNKGTFKRSRKFVKNNVISEIVRSTLSARYICVILLLTAIVLMAIYYKSILIYWQQTYHSDLLDSDTFAQDVSSEEFDKDTSEGITDSQNNFVFTEKNITNLSDESTKSIETIEERQLELKEDKLDSKEDKLDLNEDKLDLKVGKQDSKQDKLELNEDKLDSKVGKQNSKENKIDLNEDKLDSKESKQNSKEDKLELNEDKLDSKEDKQESTRNTLESTEDILRLFRDEISVEDELPKPKIIQPETKQGTISNTEDKIEADGKVNQKVQQSSTEVKTSETQVTPINQNEQPEVLPDDASFVAEPIPIVLTQNDKVFFAGDSLMQGVAPYVKKMLFKQYKIESIDLSKRSTGLSYPKAFDWPKTINDKLSEDPSIKLLVVFLGANDPWDFPVKGYATNARFKSKLWEKQYRLRIASILEHVQKHSIQVLWLAPPCMRKQKLNDGMVYLNKLYQSELEKTQQHFLTTNELLGCSYEKFNSFVEKDKEKIKVRVDDGVHFTPSGQRILAKAIMEKIIFKKLEDVHSE
ncbi:GDSL-type esterase/lipase family protein [Gilliamella apicola]|uniref:SGNH/GDSL hydrolase family protein n=1 Tax=Gilliamella apicola TaxID=1196095 RepID=UPI002FEE0820